MSNVVSELDAIHAGELALATHIQETILADIEAEKFSHYELVGRLGRGHAGVDALKTRKTWTLHYAIHTARKLGYELGKLQVAIRR